MLNKKSLYEKEYLKLERRLNELRRLRRELPLIELAKPYQSGWLVYNDFRDDIKRRVDFPRIKAAFELVAVPAYTRNKKAIQNIRTGVLKQSFFRIGSRFFTNNNIVYPTVKELPRKSIPDNLIKYFSLELSSIVHASSPSNFKYYLSIPHYWLVKKVKPYMITHTFINIYESEIKEIQNKMDSQKYFNKYRRGYKYKYAGGRHRAEERALIRHYINGDIDDMVFSIKEFDW